MAKVDSRLQDASLSEVREHLVELQRRSGKVSTDLKERQRLPDIWGQTVAGIARNER